MVYSYDSTLHLVNHPWYPSSNDRPNFGHKPRGKKCLNRKKSSGIIYSSSEKKKNQGKNAKKKQKKSLTELCTTLRGKCGLWHPRFLNFDRIRNEGTPAYLPQCFWIKVRPEKVISVKRFYCLQCVPGEFGLSQKYAINKKAPNFYKSLRNFVKIRSLWEPHFDKVSLVMIG